MVQQFQITLPAFPRGFHLIDRHILQAVGALPTSGLMHVFIRHTSAGLCINENADPDVRVDLETAFNKLAPEGAPYYTHTLEGDDDMPAHVKSILVGSSVSVPIVDGALALGRWQGIFLCEFRNRGGNRQLVVTITT